MAVSKSSYTSKIVLFLLLGCLSVLSLDSLGFIHFTKKSETLNSVYDYNYDQNENVKYDFTVVSQSSYERVYFLTYWIQRWNGPISIAFFLYGEGAAIYEKVVQTLVISNRVNLIGYFSDTYTPYPINKLRNIALNHLSTSHFWLADMDIWPAMDLYSTLVSLPTSFLARNDIVTIIPSFEILLKEDQKCDSFTSCVDLIKKDIPNTKEDLIKCMNRGVCFRFREASKTHMYHNDEWSSLPSDVYAKELPCMENDIQEPYVFVKNSPKLPHFDERFVNYGKNKVQWITHLRLMGYKYYVLSQSYAIDIPHPKSKIANDWFAEGDKTNWKTRMHVLVDAFTKEVERATTGINIQTPLCSKM